MSPSQIFSILSHSWSQNIFCFIKLKILILPYTIWAYMALVITPLKCALDVFLYNQYSFPARTGCEELVQITRFKRNTEEDSAENVCAVCLGDVGEGAEIGELRCCHVFHQICLERWVRFKHTTCPLCRGSLAAPPLINSAGEEPAGFGSVEVLFFKFCSFSSNDTQRESWWLR